MAEGASDRPRGAPEGPGLGLVVGVALLVLSTLVALILGNGNLGAALAPAAAAVVLWAMCTLPLRTSLFAVMFLAFTLENPSDQPAFGQWKSPLYTVGALLLTHMNNTLGVRALFFSGMDLVLVSLFLIALYRKMTGSPIDRIGRVSTPTPLLAFAFVSLGGAIYAWLSGLARGGSFGSSLWQVDRVFYLPMVFFLCTIALRGPRDHAALGKVLLGAAVLKACLAVYIANTVAMPPGRQEATLPYATTHHDSMLFAGASVMLLALILEKAGRRFRRIAWIVLPILVAGMLANNRRLVWVQVGLVMASVYLATDWTPLKRRIARRLVIVAPLIAVYCVAGWDSKASVFKPVATVRSVVDPEFDASTQWRDAENFNIISTVRAHPVLGTGYGHGYDELIPLPSISSYELYQFIPHNSVLGLWAYTGYFGYTALTLLWVAGVYFAFRAYHAAERPTDRAAALTSFGAVLIYLIQCYGDMGLGAWIGVFMVGAAIATAGKLAVATGAWGKKKRAEPRAEPPVPIRIRLVSADGGATTGGLS